MTLIIAVNTWFSVESFGRNDRDELLRRCETLAGGLAKRVETVPDLDLAPAEINGLPARCQALLEDDVAIACRLIKNKDIAFSSQCACNRK